MKASTMTELKTPLQALMKRAALVGAAVTLADPDAPTRAAGAALWLRPASDRVLAFPLEELISDVRAPDGQIAIMKPDNVTTRSRKYLALAVGPGAVHGWERVERIASSELELLRYPMPCGPGDVFLAGQYVGERFEWDGQELALIKASDVLCVVNVEPEADAAAG